MRNYQQPVYYPQQSASSRMKGPALAMFLISWLMGIVGLVFTFTVVLAIIGIPLLFIAFVTHLLGFIFLACVQEA